MALGGYPQFSLAIWSDARQASVWLDISLVRLFGFVAPLDDDVGLFESGIYIAVSELGYLRDV